jgi:type III pantothenate kinase
MILLLDLGNTLAKWRVLCDGVLVEEGALASRSLDPATPPWAPHAPGHALAAAVIPEPALIALREGLAKRGTRLHVLIPEAEAHGLVNRYEPPASLGPDRFAALVAARRRGLGDCLVACVGTALTVDALSAQGVFLGGLITPGPDLLRQSLFHGTARVRGEGGWAMPPRCTGDAVATGVWLALAGAVEGLRERALPGAAILLSGGARTGLVPLLRDPLIEADNLVLEGLQWIARDLGYDA